MTRLDNWACTASGSPFQAPELASLRLAGVVTGHLNPRHEDGKSIVTSSVTGASGRIITTKNTRYRLGRIDPAYRKWLRENRPNWDWRNPVTMLKEGGVS